MRISDWSSDVCSSDLRVSALESDLVQARSRGAALETDLRKVIVRLERATGDDGLDQTDDIRHQVDGLLEQLASLHAAPEGVLDRLRRSEEHTSALQSLMRTP